MTDLSEADREVLERRIDELEEAVDRLQTTLEEQERTFNILVANANLDPLEANCPECGTPGLRKRSGVSWAKLYCDTCGTEWTL